jgi:hypothetical protein
MNKIDKTSNVDALIIKIADFTDNVKTAYLLKSERYETFLYKKGPYLMNLAYKHLDSAEWDMCQLKNSFFEEWNEAKLLY